MAYKQDDIIYILTKTDVNDVAKELGLSNLTAEHYRQAQKAVEGFCGEGWYEAIEYGLRDAEDELRRRKSQKQKLRRRK